MSDVRWAPVPKWEGYKVSTDGRVVSLLANYGRVRAEPLALKMEVQRSGHLRVVLMREGRKRQAQVGQLVLEAFVGPCPPGQECRHLNDQPADNRIENLTWGTRAQNVADARRNGRMTLGEASPHAKLTEAQARAIVARYEAGETMEALAEFYGVARPSVARIIRGESWSHITRCPR